MHVVIAWWDGRRATATLLGVRPYKHGSPDSRHSAPAPLAGEFPGLRTSHWITDPTADRQGLALIWDCAASAARSLPSISERMFGCAPSHRWAFELNDTPAPLGDAEGAQAELDLLLHA